METQEQCVETLRSRITSLLKDIKDDKDFVCFGATDTSDYLMAQAHIDAAYQEIDMLREYINEIESGERQVYTEEDEYTMP